MISGSRFFCMTLLLASAAFADNIVFNQPGAPAASDQCTANCLTSSESSTGNGFRTYDQFSFSSATQFNAVSWQGFYFDALDSGNNPVSPNTVSWQIGIYADNSNMPGALLFTETVPAVDVQTTFLGDTTFGPSDGRALNGVTDGVYSFEVGLDQEFSAAANTTYWISPLSLITSSTNNPVFSWAGSPPGPYGTVFEQETSNGSVIASGSGSGNQAFALIQTPEPAGSALFVTLLLMFGALIARRRKARVN